ncbi:hypothetical protein HDU76_004829 [Blyttiomyces sp. JEL0837]|nr:hypothetical protein HDU76_004829 [Blyttiomyces sp. JEL0837]
MEQSLTLLSNSISSSINTYYQDPISISGILPFISPNAIEVSLAIPSSNKSGGLIEGYNGLSSWKISAILRVKNRSKEEVIVKRGFVGLDVLDGGRYKTLIGDSGFDTSQMYSFENVLRREVVECIADGFRLAPDAVHYSRFEFHFPRMTEDSPISHNAPSFNLRANLFGFYTRYRLTATIQTIDPKSFKRSAIQNTVDHTNIHDLDVPYYTVELVRRMLDGNKAIGKRCAIGTGWDVVVSLEKEVWGPDETMEVKVTLEPTPIPGRAQVPQQTQRPKISAITTAFYEIVSYSEPTYYDLGSATRLKRTPAIIKEKQIAKAELSNPNQSIVLKVPKFTTSNIEPPMNGSELNGPDGIWYGKCVLSHAVVGKVVVSGIQKSGDIAARKGGLFGSLGGGGGAEIEFEIPVFVSNVKRGDCEALRAVVKGL